VNLFLSDLSGVGVIFYNVALSLQVFKVL